MFVVRFILFFLCLCSYALAYTVTPIQVDAKYGGSQTITIDNSNSDKPLPYSTSAYKRIIGETGQTDKQKDEKSLLIIPPQGIVPAGSKQALRIMYTGDAEPQKSEHFYVNIKQLPVAEEKTKDTPEQGIKTKINFLIAYDVAVNFSGNNMQPKVNILSAQGGKLIINKKTGEQKPAIEMTVENTGDAYAYLWDYKIQIQDGSKTVDLGKEELQSAGVTLLLPTKSKRTFLIPTTQQLGTNIQAKLQ